MRFGLACYYVVPVRFHVLLTDLVDRFYIMFFLVVLVALRCDERSWTNRGACFAFLCERQQSSPLQVSGAVTRLTVYRAAPHLGRP